MPLRARRLVLVREESILHYLTFREALSNLVRAIYLVTAITYTMQKGHVPIPLYILREAP